jgi:hypothetical protein
VLSIEFESIFVVVISFLILEHHFVLLKVLIRVEILIIECFLKGIRLAGSFDCELIIKRLEYFLEGIHEPDFF